MTSDGFNDGLSTQALPGSHEVAERYRKHWEGFPDFKVRVKQILAADDKIVTEQEWSGTDRRIYLGPRPPGKRARRVRALAVRHLLGAAFSTQREYLHRLGSATTPQRVGHGCLL